MSAERGGRGRWYLALALAIAVAASAVPASWGTAYGQTAPIPPRRPTPVPGQTPAPPPPVAPIPTSVPLVTPVPVTLDPAQPAPSPTLPPSPAPAASPQTPAPTPVSALPSDSAPASSPTAVADSSRAIVMQIPAGAGRAAIVSTPEDADVRLTVVVPTLADRPLLVRLEPRPLGAAIVPLPDRVRPSRLFQIDIFDRDSGRRLGEHPVPLRLVVGYDGRDLALAGGDPGALVVIRQDVDAGEWRALPTFVDPTLRTVTADLSRTSLFALAGFAGPPSGPQALPTVVIPKGLPATGRIAESTRRSPLTPGLLSGSLAAGAAVLLLFGVWRR